MIIVVALHFLSFCGCLCRYIVMMLMLLQILFHFVSFLVSVLAYFRSSVSFFCVCVLCSTVSLPIRFPFIHTHTYTLCLSLYFGHKKIKYTFFRGAAEETFLSFVCMYTIE